MTETKRDHLPLVRRLTGRDPSEHHRVATPLELLYDLVLVIAIAASAVGLHHSINHGHVAEGIGVYLFMFWTLWWPWVNFTWFASAFDNDDALYRVLVFVQMIGALLTAAGIQMFATAGLSPLILIGYIVMRFGIVGLWLRAAHDNPDQRACAYRYALGITVCQIIWIAYFFFAPREHFILFALPIMALEMAVPAFAERANATPFHKHHIVERYSLLVIIVLGESLLSAANAASALSGANIGNLDLWGTLAGCFLILFAMWWIYFGQHYLDSLNNLRSSFLWGYSHFFIFASIAAVGAGVGVLVDQITHHAEVSRTLANAAVAVPVAIYLACVWFAHDRTSMPNGLSRWQLPIFAVLVLLTPFTEQGALFTGLLLTACLVLRLRQGQKA